MGAALGICALLLTQSARAADPAPRVVPGGQSEPPGTTVTPAGVIVTPPNVTAAPESSVGDAPSDTAPPSSPALTRPGGSIPITTVLPPGAPIESVASEAVDAPPPLHWKWDHFSTADYVVGATAGAVTLTAAIVHPRAKHTLSGGILFDNAVRNALRAHSISNRYIFRDASDVGLSLAVTWPFVADALTAAWWYRGSRETAEQMALIDLETMAISGAIQGVTNTLASRERPYGRDCGSNALPSDSIDCANAGHYRSFFSGHATFSFTGAALICVHHFENELLGSPWDTASCIGGYALAASTATFRVVSDVHYASDVITGALVGTIVGYGVPLLHYRHKANTTTPGSAGLELHVVPAAGGIGVLGIF